MLTIDAAEDPARRAPRRADVDRALPRARHEPPVLVEGASRARRGGRRSRSPRTLGRDDALFAVLDAAQWTSEPKQTAWRTLCSEHTPAAKLAELHAQGLPRELIGALSELLTAR